MFKRKKRYSRDSKKYIMLFGYLLGIAFTYLDPSKRAPQTEQVFQLNVKETDTYRTKNIELPKQFQKQKS
ncbi:hypothetical protein [Litchfieldia salsa]|uniref:Uncharacterized protein n=1 Tax=Litchfieldia salsa TaxID=930152 RepID=A0A1H0V4U0_9BACI|nr:hypothetical protein [Litchfieldia salsa]SDP73440.1 hypothetical protein SAMN05216565_10611 [Litchfieldia salsa]